MGLGVWSVSGRSCVPLPPTRRIASVTCGLCFLPGPAELGFGRSVYADPPAGRDEPEVPRASAALVTGRGLAGGCEFPIQLPPWARGVEPVPMTGDHVQSHLLAFCVQ